MVRLAENGVLRSTGCGKKMMISSLHEPLQAEVTVMSEGKGWDTPRVADGFSPSNIEGLSTTGGITMSKCLLKTTERGSRKICKLP